MKTLLIAFVMLVTFAAQAKDEGVYVINKKVAVGRKFGNIPIRSFSDVYYAQLFGMSKPIDDRINSLDYSKAYKCYFTSSMAYLKEETLVKIYDIDVCNEMIPGAALKAIKDADEIANPNQ